MNAPDDPNVTADIPSAVPPDSLDAGLAAGFGRPAAPRSSVGDLLPVLLQEAEGESAHVVKPRSDAMPPKEETGDRYRLDGEIARGGMGAVLRGRDVDLGRDLAIKVLLEKYANRPEVARRFIEEAQIGGQLQHPGVVPVYDIGQFGDRPFFTMKLVKGKTLAAVLGERADAAAERPRLLGIVLHVAQTLAYAHAKGVIHRDLKPANVMVGAFGEVQVMDWGLAKVLAEGGVADEERASRAHQEPEDVTTIRIARSTGSAGTFGTDTEAGSLLGTPAYMPPEQANGDIANLDRRADVFGLGALLCEILTGKPPYVGRSSEEVRRKAANGDLADATARLDACGADAELVALTNKCLSAEAADRPKDAQVVADGLTAYLNGVQERLRQAELAEAEAKAKASEEAKRRRLALALAGTVLLALTCGGGGWLWVKNERDTRQAQLTRDVNEALNQAMALHAQSSSATAGGTSLFAQAREQAQRAQTLVESGPTDAALKDEVARLCTNLDEEEKDRRLIAALEEARLVQAESSDDRRTYARHRAVPRFREALRAYGLPAGQVEPTAAAERIRQRPAAVRQAIVTGLDEWEELTGEPDHQIDEPHRQWLLAVLAAVESEDDLGQRLRTARAEKDPARRQAALENLAISADIARVPAPALTRLARRLDPAPRVKLLRRAQAHYPADFWVNHDLGQALYYVRPPELDESVRFMTAAVALRPGSPGVYNNLAVSLYARGQVDEAIACYRQAIALDPKYARAHTNLGNALKGKGQVDASIACYMKALKLDPKYGDAHNGLGIVFCDVNRDYDGAIACFRRFIELDPKNAYAHTNLGNALRGKGQVDEAIACYKKALELDPNYASANLGLGNVLCDVRQDYDGAIDCFQKAIELDPKYVHAHTNLGNALRGKGQVDEAIACYKKALELDPKHANGHLGLGIALSMKGRMDEAIACYRKAIELDPKHAMAHYTNGNALKKKGRMDEAIACYKRAIELDPKYPDAHCNLGSALASQGRFAESLAAFRRGHELGTQQPGWRYPSASAEWVRQAEQNAAAEAKLTAFLKGEFQPADNEARLAFLRVCPAKKLYFTQFGLAAAAFAADPKLADNLKVQYRYNAACAAALAAAGEGADAAKLDDSVKAKLRAQVLDWLRADVALWTRQLQSGQPADRAAVQPALRHWQQDTDLAGLRDAKALARLPADEQKAFAQLWADVAALLKKAEKEENPGPRGSKPAEKKPDSAPPLGETK
jgi:serine/threonine-protein kinase